jgi:hypothetical protein
VVISVVVFGLIVLNAIAVILKPLQEKEGISKDKKVHIEVLSLFSQNQKEVISNEHINSENRLGSKKTNIQY